MKEFFESLRKDQLENWIKNRRAGYGNSSNFFEDAKNIILANRFLYEKTKGKRGLSPDRNFDHVVIDNEDKLKRLMELLPS